ncbi:MAG TPA: hypothetical protein IAA07_09055 [Candidatus Lachnoclostridium stercoravium]|uniref:DUF3791 domain-containing protein n=1 Tax=Candidatus Lachnoclostridium stercoravium TaxID=2838633 RepID=A0A9D2KMU6_9FIRM|nr:hypothetical protein [Candidatus Lachnoclostridium stercoravium]
MVTSNDKLTTTQKETCAVISMRDAAALMAREKQISYEDALLLFAGSRIYDALFDFDTGIWKESPEYLLDLYNKFADKKSA